MSKTSQPSADDLPPTCKTCAHFSYPNGCGRKKVWNPVTGWETDVLVAYCQRLPNWFVFDRCGPKGRYWEERQTRTPPTGGSGVMPARPTR